MGLRVQVHQQRRAGTAPVMHRDLQDPGLRAAGIHERLKLRGSIGQGTNSLTQSGQLQF